MARRNQLSERGQRDAAQIRSSPQSNGHRDAPRKGPLPAAVPSESEAADRGSQLTAGLGHLNLSYIARLKQPGPSSLTLMRLLSLHTWFLLLT